MPDHDPHPPDRDPPAPTPMLRAMLDSVAEGVVGVDQQGRFMMWNAGATRLLGVGETDAGIERWAETYQLYEPDGKTLYATDRLPLARALRGESVNEVEIRVRRPSENHSTHSGKDDWRKISVNARPVVNEQGQVTGAVAVFRDITDLEAAEQSARQREIELAHVARLSTMGELASGLAHELNQPLAAISGFVEGCRRRLADDVLRPDDLDAVLQRIADQAQRAGQIIKRMRSFVRKRDPVRARVSLNETAESVAALLEAEVHDYDARLHLHLTNDLPMVEGDPIQLEQVALNLIRNALEAVADVPGDRRTVRVRTGRDGDRATLEVSDDGPGLDPVMVARVFEPFFTTKPDGLGMGLKISQTIVEAHGGRLTCRNEPAGGCIFRVQLPGCG